MCFNGIIREWKSDKCLTENIHLRDPESKKNGFELHLYRQIIICV